jgi:hypothetical protein
VDNIGSEALGKVHHLSTLRAWNSESFQRLPENGSKNVPVTCGNPEVAMGRPHIATDVANRTTDRGRQLRSQEPPLTEHAVHAAPLPNRLSPIYLALIEPLAVLLTFQVTRG